MDEEYNIMTDAEQEVIAKLLESINYIRVEVERYEEPLFRNKSRIGIRLQKIDEINFDIYQAERRNEKSFIEKPHTYIISEIEESLMDINEELLIEMGELEEELNRKEIESQMKTDFELITSSLRNKDYQADYYVTKEGFDI